MMRLWKHLILIFSIALSGCGATPSENDYVWMANLNAKMHACFNEGMTTPQTFGRFKSSVRYYISSWLYYDTDKLNSMSNRVVATFTPTEKACRLATADAASFIQEAQIHAQKTSQSKDSGSSSSYCYQTPTGYWCN